MSKENHKARCKRKLLIPKRQNLNLNKIYFTDKYSGYRNQPVLFNFNKETSKECGTQTSTTIVYDDVKHYTNKSDDSISPDSLSSSSLNDQRDLARNSCDNQKIHQLGDGSLLNIYLLKSKDKTHTIRNNVKRNEYDYQLRRSDFLLQTSPLRHIINSNLNTIRTNMKSHSFVDRTNTNKITSNVLKSISVGKGELPMMNVNKTYENNEQKMLCQNKTFMLPTISSKKKNQLHKVKSLDSLVPPIRRGHSAISSKLKYKIPYIDENKSDTDCTYRSKIKLTRTPSTTNILMDDMQDNGSQTGDVGSNHSSVLIIDSLESSSQETSLTAVINRVKDQDWNTSMKALAEIVEVCRGNLLSIYKYLPTINQKVIQLMKSSRSHVSKTACQIVANLFEIVRDTRRPEFDEIVDVLLTKTADSNKFTRQEANLALDCMVTHIPFTHAFRALTAKGPNHKHPLVRLATARLVVCSVVLLNPTVLFNPNTGDCLRKKVLETMMKFIFDKNQEVRKYGDRLFRILQNEDGFMRCLNKHFEKKQISELKKILMMLANSIK